MDPIAHTLVGATLAETRLKNWTPLATATLLIGVNLPDIDALIGIFGSDMSLLHRRGWTHGILALIVLPVLLAVCMNAVDHFMRRKREMDYPAARFLPLLGLSYISVLTHPFLDWLNTYGVRLLMPFSGKWFYGDSLFIVDPWLWLLGAASVVLAHSKGKISIAGWIVLGCATSALIMLVDSVPGATRLLWVVGLCVIITARMSQRLNQHISAIAAVCLGLMSIYIFANIYGSYAARQKAIRYFEDQNIAVTHTMAGPVAANPLARQGLILSPTHYHFYKVDWTTTPSIWTEEPPLARPLDSDAIIQAALSASSVRGFTNWMRYPSYRIEDTDYGYRVVLLDLRYTREEGGGIGSAVVKLNHDLDEIQ